MSVDSNAITHEIIHEAMGDTGRAAFGGGASDNLYYRKPFFRQGQWVIRDSGWITIKSWRRCGPCIFLSTDWHYYGLSKEIKNDGPLPSWFDDSLMCTSLHLYRPGTNRNRCLWSDVESYHIRARYQEDLPEHFRHPEVRISKASAQPPTKKPRPA